MTTYTEAVDEIYGRFATAWAGVSAIVGYVPEVRWDSISYKDKPDMTKYWCRVSYRGVDENQSTMNNGIAPGEGRRYTAVGLVSVQLFCPMSDGQAKQKGGKLAELARNAFRGKETDQNVWFFNARIDEPPPELDAYIFNIIARCEYDDIG